MTKGLQWHTCPTCQARFKGTAHRKYCSQACKNMALGLVKDRYNHESNDPVKRYKEMLGRAWINPEPWAGQSEDSLVYGNMVFL